MLASLFGKTTRETQRAARLYFSDERAIIVPMHQCSNGVYFEQSEPWVIEGAAGRVQVGEAFHRAFAAFSVVPHPAPIAKRSDWPAFRASGCRSIKAFEARYVSVLCIAVDASNAVLRACVQHPADAELEIAWHFSPRLPAETVGEGLLRLVNTVRSDRARLSPATR